MSERSEREVQPTSGQGENQRLLEDSIERMGVWITRHPSGTVIVVQGGERFTIFPHEKRWTYQIKRSGDTLPYQTGFFTRKDVQMLVHKILTWGWANGVKNELS